MAAKEADKGIDIDNAAQRSVIVVMPLARKPQASRRLDGRVCLDDLLKDFPAVLETFVREQQVQVWKFY